MASSTSPNLWPRWSLAFFCALQAGLVFWSAKHLPFKSWTIFSVGACVIGATAAATAVCAVLRLRWLRLTWRLHSVASFAFGAYLTYGLLSSALYLRSLYRGLGDGVAAGLIVVWLVASLVIVPLAWWGIARTGGIKPTRTLGMLVIVVILGLTFRLHRAKASARGVNLTDAGQLQTFHTALDALPAAKPIAPIRSSPRRPAKNKPLGYIIAKQKAPVSRAASYRALWPRTPFLCEKAVREAAFTAFVSSSDGPKSPDARCVQAESLAELNQKVAALVGRRPQSRVDLVTTTGGDLPELPLIRSLSIRPGLDGICIGSRCLTAQQLVAFDLFTTHQVIPGVPDARLGLGLEAVRKRLGVSSGDDASQDEEVARITTQSYLRTSHPDGPSGFRPLSRSKQPSAVVTPDTIERATRDAETYIHQAQRRDGQFHYLVHPYTGNITSRGFSVARQAGTTLVICELSRRRAYAKRTADRSLRLLARLSHPIHTPFGEAAVLHHPPKSKVTRERLGPAALSLAAFVACRPLVGPKYDSLIAQLTRLVLSQQRSDGGFHHHIDVEEQKPLVQRGGLYVDGQAVLSLTLVEKLLTEAPRNLVGRRFPAVAEVQAATGRAMDYFANVYWDHFGKDFFYIEENWHCLAAAASIPHHRHAGYEKLCLDYIEFKERIVHDEMSAVARDFVGGYGIANIVPPHNTATAGFGEALAASIKIRRARDEPYEHQSAVMKRVMAFLLRNQWTEQSCHSCDPRVKIVGGFSEHMASPKIRIDYVQHAWAALGHGARALNMQWASAG